MEQESVNEWKAPVIHDAIRASIFSSRYSGASRNTQETFEKALSCLKN
jgi:hypothetical protein